MATLFLSRRDQRRAQKLGHTDSAAPSELDSEDIVLADELEGSDPDIKKDRAKDADAKVAEVN